jgi:hypothetical protein
MDANIITALAGLIGTLLGGSITIASSWINNYFQQKREREQWVLAQESERIRNVEAQKILKEKEHREVVCNTIKYLSLHSADVAIRSKDCVANDYPYLNDAVNWVTNYSLFTKDKNVMHHIISFLNNPLHKDTSGFALSRIIELSREINSVDDLNTKQIA